MVDHESGVALIKFIKDAGAIGVLSVFTYFISSLYLQVNKRVISIYSGDLEECKKNLRETKDELENAYKRLNHAEIKIAQLEAKLENRK